MSGPGIPELMIILVIGLVIFDHSTLPSAGRSLGEAMKGFKKGLSDDPSEGKRKLQE